MDERVRSWAASGVNNIRPVSSTGGAAEQDSMDATSALAPEEARRDHQTTA
jgi:hypothetical protein